MARLLLARTDPYARGVAIGRLARSSILSMALAVVAAFALVLSAYAEGGTIQGKLVNATANGGSVAGVEVTLTAYFGQTERNKLTTKTDANGNFTFSGLDTNSSYSYEAMATYQKADYSAPRVSFSSSGETKQVTLKVYDATTQEDVVKAEAKHYLLAVRDGELEVSEILVLKNDSDKSYIGSREVGPDQRATGRYQPPSQAKNLQYADALMSCCVVKDGDGFVDTMAIKPGSEQKIFSYRLPYSGNALSFSSTLQQKVGTVQVLVPNTGIRANIPGLANHGAQTIQGGSYQVFGADNPAANTTLQISLEGLPAASPLGEGPALVIAISLAGLAAVGVAFYSLRRRSRPAPAYPAYAAAYAHAAPGHRKAEKAGASRVNPALLELEKRDLLAAMVNLDDSFDAGQIGRRDYERLRSEKKQRLSQLMAMTGGHR